MSRRWLGCLVMLLLLCSGRSALAAESEAEAVTPSTFVAGHLWLTLLDPGAGPRPEATLKQMTSSAKLNDLFQRFKVKLFRPVMPFARTPALRKSTADPIADASSFPGQVGAGRVNAHRAVLAALRTYTDFAINGHRSQEMQACHGEKLRLQGCTATLPFQTGPCLADSYFVSVQLSDPWWNRHGPEIMHWLSADEIADICDFDLREFVKGSGLSLTPGSYYRVKLAVGPEWQETSRLVHLEPGKSVLMINGQSTDSVEVTAGEPIFLDGCASRCAKDYFVSVQLSDLWWNRYGQEIQKWLTPEEAQDICHFDLKQFLQGTGLSWNSGNYYRVKLAVSDPWSEKSILVHVK